MARPDTRVQCDLDHIGSGNSGAGFGSNNRGRQMRTPILIATALILAAGTAYAGPRSLSGAQTSPIEPPPIQKVQILEAPKVQLPEAPKAAEQPKVQVLEAPEPPKAVDPAPAAATEAARATPAEPKPAETNSVEAKPVETKPVEAIQAPAAKPVKQAQRQKQRRQQTAEQRGHREFRSIERTIQRHMIGMALSAAALYVW
jgi:hypothetical protein